MVRRKRTPRAIDLYSGVGGWALGLRMAGIDVVASYERWGLANETNVKNNGHQTHTVDIRRLPLSDLPKDIDIVVGSPPCTQFSYSNRGGSGDITDGLQDIIKFLTVVTHLKPKAWAMENVPRVAEILAREIRPKGKLARFSDLGTNFQIVDMEQFGLPQRRRRCIAGNFDFKLLSTYSKQTPRLTLGHVLEALAAKTICDPIYGVSIRRGLLSDHVAEDFLNEEELRINRAVKTMHPVYNGMAFPDSPGRSARTITATCTRVSRESVVIEDPAKIGSIRRLTVRERATLQGFPITYQFYGASYSHKVRMVGNAFPPLCSYYVGLALRGVPASKAPTPEQTICKFTAPEALAPTTLPDRPTARYPWNRTFRFAVPSLRLKSGVRFELRNVCDSENVTWEVAFVFGTSKSIHEVALSAELLDRLFARLPAATGTQIKDELESLTAFLKGADVAHMQNVWAHSGPGGTRPFMTLDQISAAATRIVPLLAQHEAVAKKMLGEIIKNEFGRKVAKVAGLSKLWKNAALIVSGLLIGSLTNGEFQRRATGSAAMRKRTPKTNASAKVKKVARG